MATRSKLGIASLAVAAVVLGLSVAQAVRQGSLDPIWAIAWLPAVIAAAFYRPPSGKRCTLRLRR
jgi:lipopolysaccharide export LptBFGC system permease protein LptF